MRKWQWQMDSGSEGLAAWLAVDPFMPELLLGYLAAGESGDLPELPGAVGRLVRSGSVERSAVLALVLELLTTSQRPKSQRVLAGILAELEIRADEVPGGLTYLLGVLSTADRAVQPVLLPVAIVLMTDAEGCRQLTDVVAARPEKKPKELLLAALRRPETVERVGGTAVGEALGVLGSGDDAAFSAKVSAAVEALGLDPEPEVQEPQKSLGLWDHEPQARDDEPVWPDYVRWERDWHSALGSPFDGGGSVLVERELTAMARGTFDGADLSAAARTLLAEQRLSVSALRSTLEDLFLAGGLRQGWSTALAVAELAAGASTRPSGLADLFRLLARYAMELPEPQAVPPHIAALATDTTRTKASMEARRLAAALTRESEDAVVVSLRAGDTDLASLPRRGLWESMATPGPPLPSSVRLADPVDTLVARGTDLGGLRDLLCENYNGYAQSYGDISFRPPTHMPSPSLTGLTEPDRVLAATVARGGRVRRHGRP